MGFKCGIVGLPNVGKSTLFNALTNSSKAQAANFPFCTIDPNIGLVPVPDERLDNLVNISKSKKKIYTTISFVDIAGLVKGASKGEGLGNKFLSHIREVDAIIHMIRCFDSDDIQNVNPDVNPVRDLEIIETEMKLADLESIQKRLDKKNRKNIEEDHIKILERAMLLINNDEKLEQLDNEFEKKDIKICGLLSTKPKLYVCNVDEDSIEKGNNYTKEFIETFGEDNTLIISADIENQINDLVDKNEKKNFMEMLSRAWTITKNCTAPKAAGEIHTDFEKGFIRAETISYDDFIKNEGWVKSKENGKMRLEGKDYIVKDGDVLNFRFNT